MALITYPLNNIDYTAEDAELFHCTRSSGVWAEDSFPISVTGTDNNVTIGTGIAWINNEEFSGKVTALKSAEVLDLGIADSIYPRIDVIAIQFNANNNETDVIVKQGTPASNPVRPAIVRTGAIYELYLASIYRPAGATAVAASNITDLRMDGTVCGLMADSVTSVDTDAINSQITELISELRSEIAGVIDGSAYWLKSEIVDVESGGTGANNSVQAIANLGAVPTSRTINGKELSSNITLGVSDIASSSVLSFTKNADVVNTAVSKLLYNPFVDGCFFRLYFTNSVVLLNGSNYVIGTIPADFAPQSKQALSFAARQGAVMIEGDSIRLYLHEEVPVGKSMYISGFWMI